VTGGALSWPVSGWPDPKPTSSLASDVPASGSGTFGAMRFRDGALPILIPITDAAFHNGKRALNLAPTGASTDYDTTYHDAYPFTGPNIDDLVTELNKVGGKIIGVDTWGSARSAFASNSAYFDLAYIADKTGSYAPKAAFKGSSACPTAEGGASVAPDGPMLSATERSCRLIYTIGADGAGLSNAIVEGVGALLNAIQFDVYVRAYKDPTYVGSVDAVDSFMVSIAPQPTGGVDPVTGSVCTTFSPSQLKDKYHSPKALAGAGDISETIGGLNPGKLYCFVVTPKANTTVLPTTDPQTFKAFLTVQGDKSGGGAVTLGTDREVVFIVPPKLN